MKLNPFERWAVNSPLRKIAQLLVMQWFSRTVALKTGKTILEVGCGSGLGAKLISEAYHPARLYLLDLDLQMIQKANQRINGQTENQIFLCVGDAVRLPFRDDSLDAVFGFGFLHHVPAWQDGLAEVTRVLKYGGIYFMEEYYHTFELKRMGILGVGVKADSQSISCKRHEDACQVVLE
jgi:ubiquinone/menaquinone biosynthesis C-methylase UbiE